MYLLKYIKVCTVLFCVLFCSFNGCEKKYDIYSAGSDKTNEPVVLKNDNFEPNDTRETAFDLGVLPVLPLRGVLIDTEDKDWFKFTVSPQDSPVTEFIMHTDKTTNYFGFTISLYNTSSNPKGVMKYYQGPDSDAVSTFSWETVAGDHFICVSVDTNYEKKSGSYGFDILQ